MQIDELYEAYCMQRRLRDGANKMVKAYTASPGSREARESLSEANKGFKEYTEVSGIHVRIRCLRQSEIPSLVTQCRGYCRLYSGLAVAWLESKFYLVLNI